MGPLRVVTKTGVCCPGGGSQAESAEAGQVRGSRGLPQGEDSLQEMQEHGRLSVWVLVRLVRLPGAGPAQEEGGRQSCRK